METQSQQIQAPQQLNIVQLIEDNPITKLSNTYQNRLLTKIKEKFTEQQQQLFVASFYCYLNYNSTNDFVVDFDNVWVWIGYGEKSKGKRTLEKHFTAGIDYKVLKAQHGEEKTNEKKDNRGGHNKEIIMLTVKTFKTFCLKAGTKKAMELHEYYIQLEEIIHSTVYEECNELKLQLQLKDNQIQQQINQLEQQTELSNMEKDLLREKTIIEQFPKNTQCVYYGKIENKSTKRETLVKFGNSNFLEERVACHKKTYTNFCLLNAFKVDNKQQIENALKNETSLREFRRDLNIGENRYTELLAINHKLTYAKLDETIKNIITKIEYSPTNYVKLLEENESLKTQISTLYKRIRRKENVPIPTNHLEEQYYENQQKQLKLIEELQNQQSKKQTKKDLKLMEKNQLQLQELQLEQHQLKPLLKQNIPAVLPEPNKEDPIQEPQPQPEKKMIRIHNKNPNDGLYHINGKAYTKLFGSREEVWNETAYKTAGCLIKKDFMIDNASGKIVSLLKHIQEKAFDRFIIYGVNKPTQYEEDK